MIANLHEAIAGKLEAGKPAGRLSEYLVSWHGPRENLAPEVTVWRSVGLERRHRQSLPRGAERSRARKRIVIAGTLRISTC